MKINGPGKIPGTNPYQQTAKIKNKGTVSRTGKDEVQISSEAQSLLKMSEAESTQHKQRLQELKEQVHSGSYHVDSEVLAQKLLQYWKNQW